MRGFRRLWWFVVVGLMALAASTAAARAQEKLPQAFPSVTYKFGEQIRFTVRFKPAQEVKAVSVLYRPAHSAELLSGEMTWNADKGEAVFVHDLRLHHLPPFSKIFYWFRVKTRDGRSYTTASFSFVLEDNRFVWERMSAPPFGVFWYRGGVEVAQAALNAAYDGLMRAQEIWLAPTPKQVSIYIYANNADLRSALGTEPWVAAHASPELGALFVSVGRNGGNKDEIRRLVPHELAHYLLYQQAGIGYRSLPVWLNEGLASLNELSPLPDYSVALKRAVAAKRLIPMEDLCRGFPKEAGAALLAYAESASFTDYLSHRYGRIAMHNLVDVYAQGVDCRTGVQKVFGASLGDLESDWQADALGISHWREVLSNLSPWLLLVLVLLLSLVVGAVSAMKA